MNTNKKILLIEDEPLTRKVIASTLENASYQVEISRNGQEGLGMLLARPANFFLIVLDWMMPIMDGLSFVKECHQYPQVASIPIVMLTSITNNEGMLQALKTGIFDYLTKPVNPVDLLKLVDRVHKNTA